MQKVENQINSMDDFQKVLNENQNKVFIKFSANWCGPCKAIKPIVDQWIPKFPADCVFHEIDIDESLELYSFMKTKKMVNGIPAILCYYKDNTNYIPNSQVIGGNPTEVNKFFMATNF
jgi:thiol-disulfide isomerase/thioredoxin